MPIQCCTITSKEEAILWLRQQIYMQVVMQKGLPFEAKLVYEKPLEISSMTNKELNMELEKGYQDALVGRAVSVDDVFDELEQGL